MSAVVIIGMTFFAAAVDFWCFVPFGDVNGMPNVCTGRAFG